MGERHRSDAINDRNLIIKEKRNELQPDDVPSFDYR